MNRPLSLLTLLLLLAVVLAAPCWSAEAKGRYVTLQYDDKDLVRDFNRRMIIGRKLSSQMRKGSETVEDEVVAKVDVIIEKVQVVLDMFPDKIHITLVLLEDEDDVAKKYKEKYGQEQDNIAYYSLSEKTIYVSVDDANLRVVAHEVGHAVADQYFEVRPPYKIHELMAQFAERHVTD